MIGIFEEEVFFMNLMEYKGYHAKITFDSEDNIFVGEVVGIKDSLNFHGSSVEELKEMFQQSIDNYLCMCENFNKTPDKEYSGVFNVRIKPELHKKLVLNAANEEITLNALMNRIVDNYFSKKEASENKTFTVIYYMPNPAQNSHAPEPIVFNERRTINYGRN